MTKLALAKNNVESNLYDQAQYTKIKRDAQILKDALKAGNSEYQLYPELLEDTFMTCFKWAPELKPMPEVDPSFQLNRSLIQDAMATNEYQQLRAYTKSDEIQSASAAATLTEAIIHENKDQIAEINKYLTQLADQQQDLSKIAKELKSLQKQAKQPGLDPYQKNQIQQQQQQLTQQQQTIQAQIAQTQQAQQQAQSQINIGSAMGQTLDAIQFQDSMIGGWGSEFGNNVPVNYKDRLALSQALIKNKKLKQIMQMAGRMRRLAVKKQKQKTKHSVDEISDIHQSDDLGHMLPVEAILLAEPDLEILFLKKFVEKDLLCYKLEGNETKGKGPIIVCLDVSGSMEGEKDCWAKGVALAMVEIAHREKRNAIVIVFDAELKQVFEFPKNKFEFKTMIELASYFSGGGTFFDPPLKKAMEYLENEKEFKGGDVIMVTDGEAEMTEPVKHAFLDLKQTLKFHMRTVVIGSEYGFVEHSLKPISDELTPVENLDDRLAGDLFESV